MNWEALTITATELGLKELLPARNPAEEDEENQVNAEGGADAAGVGGEDDGDVEMEGGAGAGSHTGLASPGGEGESEAQGAGDKNNEVLRRLHTLLLETSVTEGKLVCGKCGFEYPIQEGVGNFLLPAHLGEYLSLPHLVVSALVTAEWSEDRLLGE